MQKRATEVLTGLAALAVLAVASTALAQEPAVDSAPGETASAGSTVQLPSSAAGPSLLRGKALDDDVLAENRGGAQLSDMKLEGVVAENNAVAIGATGTNVISQGAFANSTGVPMVVQNSGNNVLIQNATIVNVEVK
jgi:hypothetical protein